MLQIVDSIADGLLQEIKNKLFIEVEASGRHVHLSREDTEILFGKDYQLTKAKDLSQPGQFACKERVSVTGPKGTLHNVVILGPERGSSQVEVSLTDALLLGIKAPLRQSGDVKDSPGAVITNGSKKVEIKNGVIVAKRHVHMTHEDADRFHVKDGELVKVKIFGQRPLIFDDVVVRISSKFSTFIHIDYDEANACGYQKKTYGLILK